MHPLIETHLNDLIDGFPTLPAVVNRVMEITADAESSTEALFNVIQADQAISINVLKIANSVFYGLPKRVDSLQHALSILGYVEIRNMVITQAIFNSFKQLEKNGPMDLRSFWEHAFNCALAAKLVGSRTSGSKQDYYLPCLVHDIGKLMIYMALPEAYADMVRSAAPAGYKIYVSEERLFGMTHAEVALRLLSRWMLPDSVVHGVGHHHHPESARDHALYAWVVHTVDLLVHWSDLTDAGEADHAQEVQEVLLRPEVAAGLGAGANWNAGVLGLLKADMAVQKAHQSDLLALFFS